MTLAVSRCWQVHVITRGLVSSDLGVGGGGVGEGRETDGRGGKIAGRSAVGRGSGEKGGR